MLGQTLVIGNFIVEQTMGEMDHVEVRLRQTRGRRHAVGLIALENSYSIADLIFVNFGTPPHYQVGV